MAATKESIIAEIRRTASENGGVPLGQAAFERDTGISVASWRGRHWRTWNEAVTEAGLVPNVRNEALERVFLIESLARLTRKNGRFPTYADAKLEKHTNGSFPGNKALTRLGSTSERIELVRQFAAKNPEFADILSVLPDEELIDDAPPSVTAPPLEGYVYMALLRIGREKRYKIGKTNLVERRTDQISVQLPEDLELIHAIKTDDATGIEAYWHRRFAEKRTKGEWFNLSRDDIAAFKRRKFM